MLPALLGNPTLSVIDGYSYALVGSLPADQDPLRRGLPRNNHIFVPIAIPTAAAPTDTCNVMFGLLRSRLHRVYAHEK